jgi:anti-sigma regulatory factor (Ser/Thr protein kinase)
MARDVVEIAQLLTSELVTNALTHGDGSIEVQIERSPKCLRVSVEDAGHSLPRHRTASTDSIDGRGLMLVESLAARWGVTRRAGGKQVWFELRTA